MNKEFIPYTQALALKELGFDEKCFGWYSDRNIRIAGTNGCVVSKLLRNSEFIEDEEFVSAPLYQQAFRWFREKHMLQSSITSFSLEEFTPHIQDGRNTVIYPTYGNILSDGKKNHWEFDTYEEAEIECLNKLIELVKDKIDEKVKG